jgi:hypothetical protein
MVGFLNLIYGFAKNPISIKYFNGLFFKNIIQSQGLSEGSSGKSMKRKKV